MRLKARANTIKQLANEMFKTTNYVDIHGRPVGYDYEFILAEIKARFPSARTSKRWLRKMAYELTGTVRMPMRRRSRRALAEGYAMTVLLRRRPDGLGIIEKSVARAVIEKFPDQPVTFKTLRRLENHLRFLKIDVPVRAQAK